MKKISIFLIAFFLFFSSVLYAFCDLDQQVITKFMTHFPEDHFHESPDFVHECLSKKKLILTAKTEVQPMNIWAKKAFYKHLGDLTFLTELRLMNLDLRNTTQFFGKFKNLVNLYLLNTKLGAIPSHILELAQLETLSITNSYISQIPQNIGRLSELKFLNLSGNIIEKIPYSISTLKKLETLWLARNFIRKMTKHICELDKLRFLILTTNKFHVIPMNIQFLTQLELFDLCDNPLERTCSNISWGKEELKWWFGDRLYLGSAIPLNDLQEMLDFHPDIRIRRSY